MLKKCSKHGQQEDFAMRMVKLKTKTSTAATVQQVYKVTLSKNVHDEENMERVSEEKGSKRI